MSRSKSYPKRDPFHGLLVIINNVDFADQKRREGSERDAERLTNTFGQLGFEIKTLKDLTCGKMLKEMTNVAHSDLGKYDCLIIVILTHGGEGNVILGVGKNDGCTIDKVLQPLKDIKKRKGNDAERELPTLVFVQACRGEDLDDGHNVLADDVGDRCDIKDTDCIRVPIESDFFYHYSTSPGYFSFRDTRKGSVFIQTICDIYDECIAEGVEIDVLKSHLEVNGRVAENYETNNPSHPYLSKKKQMPSFVCMLRKNLFLEKQNA